MRENLQVVLVETASPPRRFERPVPEFERIAEAKARLSRPLRRAETA